MSSSGFDLNRDLAEALGLPKFTRKAVLTLEAGRTPKLEIELAPSIEPQRVGPIDVDALRAVRYVVRLAPYWHDEGPA